MANFLQFLKQEPGTGLSAVYAATTADDEVRFSAAEKAVLYKVLLDTITAHRDGLRIFSPLSSKYILHCHYLTIGGDKRRLRISGRDRLLLCRCR